MAPKEYDFTDAVPYHSGAFPPKHLNYADLLSELTDATGALARYDEKMASMVNSRLLLAPLRRQDAVASSRMEGTISTLEDVFRLEAEVDSDSPNPYAEARNDDVEVFLYSKALMSAQSALEAGQPLSEHLVRSAHQTLLSFGRGALNRPGAYKVEQNYVGDDRRGKVYFVPVSPAQLAPAMRNLFEYIQSSDDLPLLRTAIAHVEFEALHPFEDGNGRIGRMLITLMLWKLRILRQPHFFVSGYFETHKEEYIERMRAVSASDDWTGWVKFFLRALAEQAKANIRTAEDIFSLYAEMREQFRGTLNSQYHDQALDFVFGNPIFRNDRFVTRSGIPASSARALSKRLVDAGILRTIQPSSGRRAALYSFDRLIELLNT
jgi:Fic family protein